MGFRFHKSISVLPGIRVNLSKSGTSLSLGGRGATYNLGTRGTRATVGLPGSGMSYSDYRSYRAGHSARGSASGHWPRLLFIIACLGIAAYRLMA